MNACDYAVAVRPLEPELGGGFVATVDDLPGCMADGETPQQALTRAYEAIESWLAAAEAAGRPLPLPSRILKSA